MQRLPWWSTARAGMSAGPCSGQGLSLLHAATRGHDRIGAEAMDGWTELTRPLERYTCPVAWSRGEGAISGVINAKALRWLASQALDNLQTRPRGILLDCTRPIPVECA